MQSKYKMKLAFGGYLFFVMIFALLLSALVDHWLGSTTVVLAMAALAADRITEKKMPGVKSYPVKDGTKIYAGGMVAIQADGHAIPAADAASLKVVGVATHTVDNTAGADGDLWVDVEQGIFRFPATSITQAMVGQNMYVVDDQTFDDVVGTNGVKAGKLVEFVSTTLGWIRITDEKGVGAVVADAAGAAYGQPEEDLLNEIKAIVNKWL